MKRKRKPIRKLYPSEVMRRLASLERRWPDGLALFAESGTLLLVKESNNQIIDTLLIPCDGGNAGTYFENGKEYLNL